MRDENGPPGRPARRALEAVAPGRLGRSYRWLLSSSWVTNLADGLALAAGPLLVASLTSDPLLISLTAAVQWLPPLLFGLWAGAVSDRLDRRSVVLVANLLRVVLLVVLAVLVAGLEVPIWIVLSALFLLGVAEVFADNTSSTLVPTLVVDPDDLPLANARIQTGFITVNQMAGPPLGAALFAAGAAWPFVSQALLVALGVLLVSRIQLPTPNRRTESLGSVWHDVCQGIAWTWRHRAVRILIVTGTVFSGAYGIAWSVLVLYATERLGLGEIGFGLITTVGALGGLAGTASYGRLTRRYSLAQLLRAGLVVETLTHLALAATSSPWLALPVFFIFGAHDFVWGTTSVAIRHRAVPNELQGRVASVNLVCVYGGLVAGAIVGGFVAGRWSIVAPFWVAFAAASVLICVVWRPLVHLAHEDQPL